MKSLRNQASPSFLKKSTADNSHSSNRGGTLKQSAVIHNQAVVPAEDQSQATDEQCCKSHRNQSCSFFNKILN